MRRRLIQSTLAVVLVVIAVFGVSLVIVETRTISTSAQERVDSEAQRLASIVDSRLLTSATVDEKILRDQVAQDRYAVIRIPGERSIEIGTRLPGDVIQGRADGEEGETVLVEEPRSSVTREVGRTLLIIGLVALLAVVAAVVLAIRQANRLASPLTDLAETAERLGSGDPRPGTSGTASPSWTGSPTSSTPPPSASPACSPRNADSPPTPPTSSVRR
ncbi:hypothetical protein SALBM311S_09362 [Streptomyces alboniger]